MAFTALKQCRSSMQSPLSIRRFASSTTPRFAASAATDATHGQPPRKGLFKKMAETYGSVGWVIGIMFGMVGVATSIGVHTAIQQLCRSPSVQVTKRKRECVPEVEIPDDALRSGNKFVEKSFLRKVAHIQDNKNTHNIRPDPFLRTREAETLKSVGVKK